jgi:anti-anti-sigma factor
MDAQGKQNPGQPDADVLDAPLRLTARSVGAVQVLEVAGSLHTGDEERLRSGLWPLLEFDAPRVVIDLAGLTFIVSAGLSTLIGAQKEARRRGGRVYLAAARPSIANLLRVTRLDAMFTTHASVHDALQSALAKN